MVAKKVLIVVRGGVAEAYADDGVLVEIVDFDNNPDAECPQDFETLWGNAVCG